MYDIRFYKEEYIEKQYLIGNSILGNWPGTNMTNPEALKKLYSQENFDPENKLYAFKDNDMVGFLTATIKALKEGEVILRANLQFPLVIDGHEAAIDELFNRAIEVLKSKGVRKIQSRASEQWGNTIELIERYAYKRKKILNSTSNIDVNLFNLNNNELIIREFNPDTDLDIIKKMYIDNNILTEDQFDRQLKFLDENPDRVIVWNVYVDNNIVLGNSIVTKFGIDNQAVMTNITCFGDNQDKIREAILYKNIVDCKEKNYDTLVLFLFGNNLDMKKKYIELNIEFNPDLVLYDRDI